MDVRDADGADGANGADVTAAAAPRRVRRSKSAHLYLRLLDERRPDRCGCGCHGTGRRDRRYAFPKRYGAGVIASVRRTDRSDPERSLY